MANDQDTIVAPITPPGQGPVAIIRISGDKVSPIARELLAAAEATLSSPRKLIFTPLLIPKALREADEGEELDAVMAAFFKGPDSFTGEDVLELNLHGSSYILARALQLITALGARPARPGEFSERAFHNGKIDLTEAEAICDLINSETRAQHRIAEQQLSGKVSETILKVGEPLRDLLAEVEANIDFPEEDINPLTYAEWSESLDAVLLRLTELKSTFKSGRVMREGALVVLAGLPNVGKSSLLNRILGENRAIVTAIPGTTRDSIEEVCSIAGLRVRVCDTAGLENEVSTNKPARVLDEVEALGVRRSWELIERADLVLFLFDPTQDEDTQRILLDSVRLKNSALMLVVNKSDLLTAQRECELVDAADIAISAVSGDGVASLTAQVARKLLGDQRQASSIVISSERHFNCLTRASSDLEDSLSALSSKQPAEFIAFHLRAALNSLSEIVGVTENEEILGRIFSKFCIGK